MSFWIRTTCMTTTLLITLITAAVHPAACFAAEPVRDPYKDAMANPVDAPGLPRVLIIGDSISIGYTPQVRTLLKGKANVHRPTTNCRWSAFGAAHLDEWLGDAKWDVVHFNFGLWDWYGWRQEQKATPASYAANLEKMVLRLKKTGARLIFATTTPPCVAAERSAHIVVPLDRAAKFRSAALAVMKKHGVAVNDLYGVIGENRTKYQRGANDVHYNNAGRTLLATHVAKAIQSQLHPEPAR